jgi:ribosomal protein S27E
MRDRHAIAPGARIYCEGTALRPCPARAWWYHEGKRGRPQKRCPLCHADQRLIVKAESGSIHPAQRCMACGFALASSAGGRALDIDTGRITGAGTEIVTRTASYCLCDILS